MNQLFDIVPSDITSLSAQSFVDLINRLLHAEASRIGMNPVDVNTSLRITVADGGVDARVSDNDKISEWIPRGTSIWQYKSGADHEPADLRTEFAKPGVQAALSADGSYRVVIKDDLPDMQRQNRIKALQECCDTMGVPRDRVKLLAADQVAKWTRENVALRSLPCFSRPGFGELIRWDMWACSRRYSQPFQTDNQRSGIIAKLRSGLADPRGPIRSGVRGRTGVGKSRLAMEALRPADDSDGLSERVLYAESPNAIPPGLISWVAANPVAELVLVIDECEADEATRIEERAERSNGRIRILTIGQGRQYRPVDSGGTNTFVLDTLDGPNMLELLETAIPGLDHAHYALAIKFASGFVKLAVLVAEAMFRTPDKVSAKVLLEAGSDVNGMIEKYVLPDAKDRRVMQALSLMSRVGWEDELKPEGQGVMQHMNVEWLDAQLRVGELTRKGIVAKLGRYRYVTPHLLGVYLATQAWEDYGTETINLLKELPWQTSLTAFLERLRDIGEDPTARRVCEVILGSEGTFTSVASINDEWRSKAFALLAETHPTAGLAALEQILHGLPRDELVQFKAGRRQIIWLLEKLAWPPETFEGAARLLLLLAEAENETWGNNASGTWVDLFGTRLGNTAAPPLERQVLIKEALESDAIERNLLGLRAISRIFATEETGSVCGETQVGRIAPPRWSPSTWDEDRQVRISGLELLDVALSSQKMPVKEAAWEVLLDRARDLVRIGLAEQLLARLEPHLPTDFEERRKCLGTLEKLLDFEEKHLSPEQHSRLRAVCDSLAGSSYGERLRLWTGDFVYQGRRDPNEPVGEWYNRQPGEREKMSASLAEEAMADPDLLQTEWEWLSIAPFTYFFAKRLGEMDEEERFWSDIEALARVGKGNAMAAGYLAGRKIAGSDRRAGVLENWSKDPQMALAVLDLAWRGDSDEADLQRVIELVRRGWVAGALLSAFTLGDLPRRVSAETFLSLVTAHLGDASEVTSSSAALAISQRLQYHPEDHDILAPPAWEAFERPKSMNGQGGYLILDLMTKYASDDPRRVARAIMKLYEEKNPPLIRETPEIQLLELATTCDPRNVWAEVAPLLMGWRAAHGRAALYVCLQGWYAQLVGQDVLIPWADENLPDGPHIVASMTCVKAEPSHLAAEGEAPIGTAQSGPLDPLVRELLIHYRNDESVVGSLATNFTSGSFVGNFSGWLQWHQEIANGWVGDPAPAVRSWAKKLVASLANQIEGAIAQEEEGLI